MTLRFNFTLFYVPGEKNRLADYPSWEHLWSTHGQSVVDNECGVPLLFEVLVHIAEATITRKRGDDPAWMDMKNYALIDED